MGSGCLRPGFHLDGSFNAHRSSVRQVIFNSKRQYYVSLDDKCIRAWCSGPRVKQIAVLHFPAFQPSFITSIVYADKIELLFASALDKSIKLYNDNFELRASLSWSAGAVLSMIYNERFDELITAGSDGVKVWFSEPNLQSYYFDGREPFERAKRDKSTGKYVKWTFGQHQSVEERMSLRVPGANLQCAFVPNCAISNGEWCQRLILEKESQVLIVMLLGSVYIFDIETGLRIHQWEGLHTQPVTGVIYLPDKLMVFTSSQDANVIQWQLMADGSLQLFRRITDITTPVSGILFQPHVQAILTSTFDGMITLWSLETFESIFRMKVLGAALGLTAQGDEKFFFYHDNSVKVMWLRHIFTTLKMCNSKPMHLQTLDNEQIATLYDDTSLRIMDTTGKDMFTTVPQLSTKSVVETDYCPERRILIVLFGDGCIHIWHMRVCNPPRLARVWTHLMKDNPVSFRFLRKESIPSIMTTLGRGLARSSPLGDILIVGTKVGGLILCDMRTSQIMFRTSGFEKEPILGIALDSTTENLLVHSHNIAKILRLGTFMCASQLHVCDEITKIAVSGGKGLIGGRSGRLLLVDLCSGRHLQTPQSLDHAGRITSISTHLGLTFFITASTDGCIQILDRNNGVHAKVVVGGPVECACFLNNNGDVLVGVGNRLQVAKSDVYAKNFRDGVKLDCAAHGSNMGSRPKSIEKAPGVSEMRAVNSMSPSQKFSSPRSSPKDCLVFEAAQENFELLALNKRQIVLHTETTSNKASSNLVGDLGKGFHTQEMNHIEAHSKAQAPTSIVATKYLVQLPVLDTEADDLDQLKKRTLKARGKNTNSEIRNSLQIEGLAPTNYGSSSDHSSNRSSEGSDDCYNALEESFRHVAPVVASKAAFYPGLPDPKPTLVKTRRKKKVERGKRRRGRRTKRASRGVGLSWEDRMEQLRKVTIENKVILGLHELKAQETGTKSAVKSILPIAPRLASETQTSPVGFVPR